MLKNSVLRVTPDTALNAYRMFKKNVWKRDVHVRLDAVALRHVARYCLANDVIKDRDVLDAACGSGYGAYVLSRAAAYTGLDLDHHAVGQAHRCFPGFSFVTGSVFDLPREDASVGAVVSFETLEHVRHPERAMAEFARVLRPGGVLVGSIPINHPDRIYHVRPYSAVEAYQIFDSDSRLKVSEVAVQKEAFRFQPISDHPDELAAISSGTLLVTLSKQD